MAAGAAACVVPLGPEAATAHVARSPPLGAASWRASSASRSRARTGPRRARKLVWQSGPGGRGRVTEKVKSAAPTAFGTLVYEERLVGTQTFRAAEDGEGSRVELTLDYELTSQSPLKGVTDLLFIRRALRDALGRTLRRFSGRGRGRGRAQVGSVPGMAKEPRPLSGKVVAITGAARGIGLATARACAARGMKVAIGDLDEARGQARGGGRARARSACRST